MRGFLHDLKIGVRALLATRWTTLAAVLILALGTGVNTSVLAVAYGILLRPLPYADPSRVVVISLKGSDGTDWGMPLTDFDDWRSRLRTVRYLAAYSNGEFTVRGLGEPRVARTALVKGEFFKVMGVAPLRGQAPPGDRDGWLVVSERKARELAGDRNPLGAGVTVGQGSYVVAAVMPDSFAFPSEDIGAWMPPSSRTSIGFGDRPDARSFRLIARLGPGVTIEQAKEDASRVLREIRPLSAADPNARKYAARANVTSIDEIVTGPVTPVLTVLLAAALLVLLVACGNVASLFVGRAAGRAHDLAVRLALGASRWRLVRAVLAESLVVAVAASTAGVWIGYALVRVFTSVAAGVFPRLNAVAIDLPVLAASALVAFVITLLCGAAPALNAARTSFAPAFRATAATRSRPVRRLRAALVIGQIALSIVLLAGAGLIVRTVSRLLDQAGGFQPKNVVALRLVMSDTTTFTATSRVPFVKQFAERAKALPGVQAAGIGSALPPRVAPLQIGIRLVMNGQDRFQVLTLASVTPGYLEALGARLVRGRLFNEADTTGEAAALLSESAARHLKTREDPIGRPLLFPLPMAAAGRTRKPKVVGIVGDIKYTGLDSPNAGTVYVLWPDLPAGLGHLVVRGSGSPAALTADLRRIVREADPSMPVPDVRLLQDEVTNSIADRRVRVVPALSFAVLALGVALTGLSAAMTRAIAERRRELAIRGALGASPSRTVRMVVGEGAIVTTAGVVLGLGAAAGVGRTLARLLYGVSPYDPLTFAVVGTLVGVCALGISYLAARRALRVDLLELLRSE
ncbi:MAG: ADOP family duplicated permease [Bacteroidales bacterium]